MNYYTVSTILNYDHPDRLTAGLATRVWYIYAVYQNKTSYLAMKLANSTYSEFKNHCGKQKI